VATNKQIWQYAPESFINPKYLEKNGLIRLKQIKRKECVSFFLGNKMTGSSSYYDRWIFFSIMLKHLLKFLAKLREVFLCVTVGW
jgi:hypothetical protein